MAQTVKNLPAMQETWVRSLGWEDPLEKEMATHSRIFLPRKFHGWRSLVGYRPWGRKELDTTELLHFQTFTFISMVGGTLIGNVPETVKLTVSRYVAAWKVFINTENTI